jgi:hypothetical protein
MVSTAILAWMIIVANQMLVSSRQAIREAEGIIRSNANARAVATRIREDLEQVSSDGVLMIMEVPPKLGVQRRSALSFTSVGSYQSVTDPTVKSNLARVDYGLSMNPNASWYRKDDRGTASLDDDIAFGVLYRRAMVSLPGLGSDLKQDYENMCLSYYRFQPMAPASNLETWMGGITAMWTNNNHPEGSK